MQVKMLNTQSPIPLYRQLADLLTARIRSGEYAPGGKIPSEHKLAATFSIGRPTARQAIDLLAHKGLLIRRRGAGTFVTETQQEVDLFSLDGTIASFHKGGLDSDTRIITPLSLRDQVDGGDHPFKERASFFMSRLTRVNDTPVLIEDIYLDAALFAGIDQMNLEGASLSAIAEEKFYLRPTGGKQSFDIVYPDSRHSRFLEVPSETPVLMVKRYLHFPQLANGVFCLLWCRTDQFVFTQNIGGVHYG